MTARGSATWRAYPRSARRERRHEPQVRLGVDASPGRGLDERLGVEPPAVAVHVLGEPRPDRGDIAGAQRVVLRAELGLELLPELRGDQAPERVAREVAE